MNPTADSPSLHLSFSVLATSFSPTVMLELGRLWLTYQSTRFFIIKNLYFTNYQGNSIFSNMQLQANQILPLVYNYKLVTF